MWSGVVVFGRQVVDGVEWVAVRVEHRFTVDEAVIGVLAAHPGHPAGPAGRPAAVGTLSVREVRAALKKSASDRLCPGMSARLEGEHPGGRWHRSADAVRAELVRLRMFSEPGGGAGAGRYEFVAVPVEHRFAVYDAVVAVMSAKAVVRPVPGRRIVPLTVREVRRALEFSARHGPCAELVRRWQAEPAGGPLEGLAGWVRAELVRLRVFSGAAAETT
ncbi:hypothetical protein GCM10022222_33310 [Amycolatopsis ultiminotia]|uniref:Uncharacterized protein n=1 Tax=Amycolatopsis ultiminotia TaxID=543629 RepID=A0ABP6WBR6_9PSEU